MKLLICWLSILILWCNSQQNYFIDTRTNCNNVYDATNSEYVRYLGKFASTNACIDACLHNSTSPHNQCESYSYYTKQFDNNTYATNCYGRFGSNYGLLWTPIDESNVNCGRIIYKCQSDFDCEYNGKCDLITGNCTCFKAWSGYHCQQLNLEKATTLNGYHIINDNNSGKPTSSWGGSVLIDKSDQNNNTKFHMFVSEFDNHCGVNSWSLNSVVTHTQSTNGYNSPYKRIKVLHSHFAHEINAIYGPNHEIVLYYSAYNFSAGIPECVCEDGSTPPTCRTAGYKFINIMDYSPSGSMNGPWKRTVVFPNKSVDSGDTNLNGVILKNGTFIGMMRYINHNGSVLHLVQSNNWKDGSSYFIHNELLFPQLIRLSAEDTYMYRDCNGYFHAIFHNESPGDLQVICGGHAWSENGVDWVYGGYSYGNTVQFIDATNITFTRRERPHFILDSDGCTPIALTTGSQYGGRYGDATWTVLQPIAH